VVDWVWLAEQGIKKVTGKKMNDTGLSGYSDTLVFKKETK